MSSIALNRKLTLEAPQKLSDGAGGYETSWRVLGTLWAQLSPATGRQASGDAGALSQVPFKAIVRAFPEGAESRPVAGQRFIEGNRIYAIRAVSEHDAQARYLEVVCEEERAT